MDWQLAGIIVAIVGAVVVPIALAIHQAGRSRSERNEKRIDDHVSEDIKAHERLARVETRVDRLERETENLRTRWHDLRDDTLRKAFELFTEWKDEIVRTFKRKDE